MCKLKPQIDIYAKIFIEIGFNLGRNLRWGEKNRCPKNVNMAFPQTTPTTTTGIIIME